MYPPSAGNAGLLGALFSPTLNVAGESALINEQAQLATINAQQQQQIAQQGAQAEAQVQQGLSTLGKLPFMGRDKKYLAKFLRDEENALYETIKTNHKGSFRDFYQSGKGQIWQDEVNRRLQNQSFYQRGLENSRNVMAAQDALNKGNYLVGGMSTKGYRSGEQDLSDFLAGNSDTYALGKYYSPKDVGKQFEDITDNYAPGVDPWVPTYASQNDIGQSLVNKNGAEIGADMYHRLFKGTQVKYKTDSILKLYEETRAREDQVMQKRGDIRAEKQLGLSQANYRLAAGAQNRANVMANDHLKTSALQRQLLQQKIDGKEAGGGSDSEYMSQLASMAQSSIPLSHETDGKQVRVNKALPSGKDLTHINNLDGFNLLGDQKDLLPDQLGLRYNAKTGSYGRGNLHEGFTVANGVHPVNLSGARFDVVNIGNQVFFDRSDNTKTGLRQNTKGYTNVTIKFHNQHDAEKAGVYSWYGNNKAGTGSFNVNTYELNMMVPIGDIDAKSNAPFAQAMRKAAFGQKGANEGSSLYIPPYTDLSVGNSY